MAGHSTKRLMRRQHILARQIAPVVDGAADQNWSAGGVEGRLGGGGDECATYSIIILGRCGHNTPQ